MLRVIVTVDYEIHGNGEGTPQMLMIEPTERMIDLFDRYGGKLTIMADVAEIFRFREYARTTGEDRFGFEAIVAQLQRAVATGHDVQLHLHPSYAEAVWDGTRWQQHYPEYDLARLRYDRIVELVREGKEFLEETLRPSRPEYRCTVFRAGNWAMQPSESVVAALVSCGIRVDTSVFSGGRRTGLASFDYTNAWSDIVPWPASKQDICRPDPASSLWEIPIYAEQRWIGAFLSFARLHRVVTSRIHPVRNGAPEGGRAARIARGLSGMVEALAAPLHRHAWKLDFNQCTGRQLIAGLRRAADRTADINCALPIVLIGHSKLFTRRNARSVRPFLEFVSHHSRDSSFGTFGDLDLEAIRGLSVSAGP